MPNCFEGHEYKGTGHGFVGLRYRSGVDWRRQRYCAEHYRVEYEAAHHAKVEERKNSSNSNVVNQAKVDYPDDYVFNVPDLAFLKAKNGEK